MTRLSIERRLTAARDAGRKLLVPYLTAGYPDPEASAVALRALTGVGADAVELGVPFSDPLADGPVIAAASQRAIEGRMTLAGAIEIGSRWADAETPPLVLFTYLNPILARGAGRVAAECAAGGFDAALVADLPFDEDPALEATFAEAGLALVRLAAPTSPIPRLRLLAREARGFVYLIARTGITGAGAGEDPRLAEQVRVLREETALPIVVGFGIRDGDQARRVAETADGIVVGSAFVERLGKEGPEAAVEWLATIRDALDRG